MADVARWQHVKGVFQQALERPRDARPAFLDEACGSDGALRREVESLLAAERNAGDFLSRPAGSLLDPPDAHGRRIGPYRVLDTVGRGGMGVVYRAVRDDDVFHKTVALKLVHGGAGAEYLRRLGREREILARLQHANIATILDGGATAEGEPYLVMEYVEGVHLTAYCDSHGLSTRERLDLFKTVCSAVHYAHQHLVVHRDLKPHNILVTPEGHPKLLDFGIAKLLEGDVPADAAPTATMLPVMTPEYASPEQVSGQAVTTASDVYSLAVVLYEVLTGRLPIDVKTDSLEGIVRSVCHTEPLAPSAAARIARASGAKAAAGESELRGDVDTMLLKALRKEPARRYLSAQEFAEDLGRHLDGRPVRARKDTLGYRAGKFAGRHRTGVAAAILILVSLLGGLVATAWQWRRAERRFAEVRTLAHSVLFELYDAIKELPGSTQARALVVRRAQEYLDSLAAESTGDPGLQRELALAYHRIADVQGNHRNANLGDAAGALASYRKALSIEGRLAAASPEDRDLQRELAHLYVGSGDVQTLLLDLDGAQDSYRKSLAIQERLSAGDPHDEAAMRDAASSLHGLAGASVVRGDHAEARASCRRAVEIREAIAIGNPNDDQAQRDLASSYKTLGDILKTSGDPAGALDPHHRALAIREELLDRNPGSTRTRSEVASSQLEIGNDLVSLGDLPGALQRQKDAVEILTRIATADPSDAQARWLEGLALNSVGNTLRVMGRAAEALRPHEQALAIFEALSRADPTNDSYSYNRANTLQLVGDANRSLAAAAGARGHERELWEAARTAFERSAGLFKGMRERGTMSARLEPDAARVEAGRAECASALARLASASAAGDVPRRSQR